MRPLLLATIIIISSRFLSTKSLIILAVVKEVPSTSLRINTVFDSLSNKKYTVELNRLLSKSRGISGEFLRRQCKIQVFRDGGAEGPRGCIFQAFREFKNQNSETMVSLPG